jgi:tetratricopeptide (TPR) repeat protein
MYFVRATVAVRRRSPDAEDILRDAIAFETHRGVLWARLGFQGWLGLYLVDAERLQEAEELLEATLSEAQAAADHRTSSFIHVGLSRLRLAQGQESRLVEDAAEVLASAEEYGEEHNIAHLHAAVGEAHLRLGDSQAAYRHLSQARAIYVRLGAVLDQQACDQLMNAL